MSNNVQFFQPNGGRIDFYSLKWDRYLIFGFLCLIKPDSDRISTLEQKIGYYTVWENGILYSKCQPSWIFRLCINLRLT